MRFQIKEIILWPRNFSFEPRRLKFELGKVNVISGAQRTGKSAVVPIIDYCLASSTCSIPVNTIRKACEWFGVIVSTANGDKLFARREPGAQRSTDDMFIREAKEITDVPKRLQKNISAEKVRRLLDEIAGLSNLDFTGSDMSGGFDARLGFRDLSAFVFQPQNIIANPDVLFFKANTYEHRERLRKLFPYVLGAITPALMAKQHELRRIQVEFRRKEKEMKEMEVVSSRWLAELRAKVSEAQELGLLEPNIGVDLSSDQMLGLLKEIVKRTDLTIFVSTSTISAAVRELTELNVEESKVSSELISLRRRLADIVKVQASAVSYHDALRIQRDRLQISDWFLAHTAEKEDCPVCGNDLDSRSQKLLGLHSALKLLEQTADQSSEMPAAFDRETQRVKLELDDTTERLRAIQIRQKALSNRSTEASQMQFKAKRAERFVGNLESALELYNRLGADAGMRTEVDQLKAAAKMLEVELRSEEIESKKERALRIVNLNAGLLLPGLDIERPNDPISLEINDLTIKVTGSNREDYLSEIGSGSNWLSYHIAVLFGLHQYFLALSASPVPSFIVIDQPSQVYFPRRLATGGDEQPDDLPIRDEDVDAVRKAFQVIGKVVHGLNEKLQVIILDHARQEIWDGIESTVGLEEWRDGKKLVPTEWLSA
jgi:Protein of unknown function (DUF3732)